MIGWKEVLRIYLREGVKGGETLKAPLYIELPTF